MKIKRFKPGDLKAVVELFNLAFKGAEYNYPLNPENFRSRVLNNPDYKAEGACIAVLNRQIIGYVLAAVKTEPLPDVKLEKIPGYLCLIMVHPEFKRRGIGGRLLEKAFVFWKHYGKKEICIGPPLVSFFPGVNANWMEARNFFNKYGFVERNDPHVTMRRGIMNFQYGEPIVKQKKRLEQEGYSFVSYRRKYEGGLLSRTSGWWTVDVASKIKRVTYPSVETPFMETGVQDFYNPDEVTLVVNGNRVYGYCVMCRPGGGKMSYLGPIWVDKELRGKSVGSVLIQFVMMREKERGTEIIDLWTNGAGHYNSTVFYPRNGFRIIAEWKQLGKAPEQKGII